MQQKLADSNIINDHEDHIREEFEHAVVQAIKDEEYEKAKQLLATLHPADLADFIDRISTNQRATLISIFRDIVKAEVILELDDYIREKVFLALGFKESAKIIEGLNIDELATILIDCSDEVRQEIMSFLSINKAKEISNILAFPEHSAGRIMSKQVVSIPEYWTVGQTIDYIRQNKDLPTEFYQIFVINPKHHPVGGILVSTIMHYGPEIIINDIMNRDIKIIDTHKDQEQISFLFSQYGLVSLAVVDKMGRLVGTITVKEAVEIIEQEAEEDLMHMGGINKDDFYDNIISTVCSRFPWLFINLITASFVAGVITLFESSIGQMVVLAAIMPVVASLGGNSGTQTMTMSVVAIAAKEISGINAVRVVLKQITASILTGIAIALIGGIVIMFWQDSVKLGIVFFASIVINFGLAGFFGSAIPIALSRVGADPAISSPVLLTAVTDLFGFLTFLGLATIFLL